MLSLLIFLSTLVLSVLANVEKTIFLAPPAGSYKAQLSSSLFDDFTSLDTLSPSTPSIRKHLDASFPSDKAPRGVNSWFRLTNLSPGQRYEVRICWLATQPTSFHLNTYTLSDILASKSLSSSLATYSANSSRQLSKDSGPAGILNPSPDKSSLFLAIDTAADYFTLNNTLMNDVPPVVADIILDPFLLNVFPKSLVPTAGYIVVTAVIAWFFCGIVQSRVRKIAGSSSTILIVTKRKSQ